MTSRSGPQSARIRRRKIAGSHIAVRHNRRQAAPGTEPAAANRLLIGHGPGQSWQLHSRISPRFVWRGLWRARHEISNVPRDTLDNTHRNGDGAGHWNRTVSSRFFRERHSVSPRIPSHRLRPCMPGTMRNLPGQSTLPACGQIPLPTQLQSLP